MLPHIWKTCQGLWVTEANMTQSLAWSFPPANRPPSGWTGSWQIPCFTKLEFTKQFEKDLAKAHLDINRNAFFGQETYRNQTASQWPKHWITMNHREWRVLSFISSNSFQDSLSMAWHLDTQHSRELHTKDRTIPSTVVFMENLEALLLFWLQLSIVHLLCRAQNTVLPCSQV